MDEAWIVIYEGNDEAGEETAVWSVPLALGQAVKAAHDFANEQAQLKNIKPIVMGSGAETVIIVGHMSFSLKGAY